MSNRNVYTCSYGRFEIPRPITSEIPSNQVIHGTHEKRRVSYLPCKNKEHAKQLKLCFVQANSKHSILPNLFAVPLTPVSFYKKHFLAVEYLGADNSLYDVLQSKVSVRKTDKSLWFYDEDRNLRLMCSLLKKGLDLAHKNGIYFGGGLSDIFQAPNGSLTLIHANFFSASQDEFSNAQLDVLTFKEVVLDYLLLPLGLPLLDNGKVYLDNRNLRELLHLVSCPPDLAESLISLTKKLYLQKIPFKHLCADPSFLEEKDRAKHLNKVVDHFYLGRSSNFEALLNAALEYCSEGLNFVERMDPDSLLYPDACRWLESAPQWNRNAISYAYELCRFFRNNVVHYWDYQTFKPIDTRRAYILDRYLNYPLSFLWMSLGIAFYSPGVTTYAVDHHLRPMNVVAQDFLYL